MLCDLRAAGVSIRSEGGRLIVEAPAGAVTEEMRAQLVRRKAELVSALESDRCYLPSEDPIAAEALHEVGGLFAVAYLRRVSDPRVPVNQPKDMANKELAFSSIPSVHEHGCLS